MNTWNVRRRPRIMSREKSCYNRVGGASVRGNLCWIRHACQRHYSYALALPFVIKIEECLVLDDRTAQRSAELIVVEWRPPTHIVEVIPRVQPVISKVIESGAMQSVRPALRDDIDRRASVSSILRHEIGHHLRLLYRIHGKNGSWSAKHSRLVDGWIVAIAVIHVRAIKQAVISAPTRPLHGNDTDRSVGTTIRICR